MVQFNVQLRAPIESEAEIVGVWEGENSPILSIVGKSDTLSVDFDQFLVKQS